MDQIVEKTRFQRALSGEALSPPPVWLMRQAGRYLAEYRATRKEAGSFLDLCYSPELATEVTMQPIRRYDFDAAILFADILIVPDALGQNVRFVEGEGPRLDPADTAEKIAALSLDHVTEKYASICQSVSMIRSALADDKSLIGFCGAPWTVATYMIAGRGTPDQAPTRLFAYQQTELFQQLIDLLVDASAKYLSDQINAGADAVQIFDSWAGPLPDNEFERWVTAPTKKLVAKLRETNPGTPIIGFPRGATGRSAHFIRETGIDAIGCDTAMPLNIMRDELAPLATVQGNLDPMLLISGGDALNRRVDEILETMSGKPFIFNLGHGIDKTTPPDHVTQLMERIRQH